MTRMPEKLRVLKAKEVVRALERAGFYVHHQVGSHARLLHRTKTDVRVTVPIHSKGIPPTLLRRILKQGGLTDAEFIDLIESRELRLAGLSPIIEAHL